MHRNRTLDGNSPAAYAQSRAAEVALAIYESILHSVRADRLVQHSVTCQERVLKVLDLTLDLHDDLAIYVAGAGKASVSMANALVGLLPPIRGGLVISKEGDVTSVPGVEVVRGSHPIPSNESFEAGRKMLSFVSNLDPGSLLLFCLSGGASALMESPRPGVSREEIVAVNKQLLASGANIHEINSARSKLSAIKAGGLALACGQVEVVVLVLSDVAGDDLAVIGSGPFWRGSSEELKHSRPTIHHRIIGSNRIALEAGAERAHALGYGRHQTFMRDLNQDVRASAGSLATEIASMRPGEVILLGGEPTVVIQGDGKGGRAQELATRLAPEIAGRPDFAVLAGSTDGTDGPGLYAGGLVDSESMVRATAKNVNFERTLTSSNSFSFLEACDGLITTGPTGSNVNDVLIVVRSRD